MFYNFMSCFPISYHSVSCSCEKVSSLVLGGEILEKIEKKTLCISVCRLSEDLVEASLCT